MEYHAKMIRALSGGLKKMGPNVKALYDRFMSQKDEECIAHESQIVLLFQDAVMKDAKTKEVVDGA